MKFVLLGCASAKEDWSDQAIALYTKKISPFVSFEVKDLKTKKSSREEKSVKKKLDSEALLAEIKSDDFVVVFDETGTPMNSIEFSSQLQRIFNSGKKRTLFIVGGAFGVSPEVQKRAQVKISLSKMVFNHLVARTVILEQIYRALAIIKNLPYHNE